MVQKLFVTYNDVHRLCQDAAPYILAHFRPQLMIAIGGGGYVPARILRTFLSKPGTANIPIQAIGLYLYDKLPSRTPPSSAESDPGSADAPEVAGTKVKRTQWLDFSSLGEIDSLIGRRILIVDEIDDTRTTLEYAVRELEKDVEAARLRRGLTSGPETEFSIFVLHNKVKPKRGVLPDSMMEQGRYLAAQTIGDLWITYPWEATNIEEHDRLAKGLAGTGQ